jgi:hypothetical protein
MCITCQHKQCNLVSSRQTLLVVSRFGLFKTKHNASQPSRAERAERERERDSHLLFYSHTHTHTLSLLMGCTGNDCQESTIDIGALGWILEAVAPELAIHQVPSKYVCLQYEAQIGLCFLDRIEHNNANKYSSATIVIAVTK